SVAHQPGLGETQCGGRNVWAASGRFSARLSPVRVPLAGVWNGPSMQVRLLLILLSMIPALGRAESGEAERLIGALARAAPAIDRQVLSKAVTAMNCAVTSGVKPAQRLAIIDFSLSSNQQRLWIFDLERRRLLI